MQNALKNRTYTCLAYIVYRIAESLRPPTYGLVMMPKTPLQSLHGSGAAVHLYILKTYFPFLWALEFMGLYHRDLYRFGSQPSHRSRHHDCLPSLFLFLHQTAVHRDNTSLA